MDVIVLVMENLKVRYMDGHKVRCEWPSGKRGRVGAEGKGVDLYYDINTVKYLPVMLLVWSFKEYPTPLPLRAGL